MTIAVERTSICCVPIQFIKGWCNCKKKRMIPRETHKSNNKVYSVSVGVLRTNDVIHIREISSVGEH